MACPSGDAVLQRRALQILHDNEGALFVLTDVVNRADVGVVQRRSRTRLSLEASECLGISCDFIRKKLERYETAQPGVPALYTTPIPPPPNLSTMR